MAILYYKMGIGLLTFSHKVPQGSEKNLRRRKRRRRRGKKQHVRSLQWNKTENLVHARHTGRISSTSTYHNNWGLWFVLPGCFFVPCLNLLAYSSLPVYWPASHRRRVFDRRYIAVYICKRFDPDLKVICKYMNDSFVVRWLFYWNIFIIYND